MKTRAEVEELKVQWELDSCWDLYETEGFEEYREELFAHQSAMESKWQFERDSRLAKLAVELGVPGNFKLARIIKQLADRIKTVEARISGLQ